MEIVLLVIGIVIVARLFSRPAPRPQIFYVPVEIVTPQSGGMGCLPLIIIGLIILLAMMALRF